MKLHSVIEGERWGTEKNQSTSWRKMKRKEKSKREKEGQCSRERVKEKKGAQ